MASTSAAPVPHHAPPPPEFQPPEKKLKTEEDEVDDDDEWGFVPIPVDPELLEKYKKQVEESEGFDIDYFPGMVSWNLITPVVGEDLNDKSYRQYAQRAVDHYNKDKQDGKLELLKVLKVNIEYYVCPHVYATFEAKVTADDKTKIYQAEIVLDGPTSSIFKVFEFPYNFSSNLAGVFFFPKMEGAGDGNNQREFLLGVGRIFSALSGISSTSVVEKIFGAVPCSSKAVGFELFLLSRRKLFYAC